MGKKRIGTCIYCNQEKELSREHYLPECLGHFQGFETLYDRICKTHNNDFKQLEEQFCRGSVEAFFRHRLGIEGKKHHKKINPFYRGSAGAKRLDLKAKVPDESLEILWEPNVGSNTITTLRQIVIITKDGTIHHIPIGDDMKEPAQLRTEFDKIGIKEAKELRIFCAETEKDWIESLLSGFKVEWQQSPDKGQIKGALRFIITDKYFRALAKIGFHFFLKHIHRFRGPEENFTDIRKFIIQGGDINKFITLGRNQIVKNLYYANPTTYYHVLVAKVEGNRLYCILQFFIGPDYRPPVYIINLGLNSSLIHYDETVAYAFEYFPEGKEGAYNGKMIPMAPIKYISLSSLPFPSRWKS